MKLISKNCVNFIKSFEGFSSTAYRDIVGVKTLGYGMTGKEISGLTYVTEVQASNILETLLNYKYANTIKNNLDSKGVKLNQNEFDAIVSMAYNIGVGGLLGSTLYMNICKGIRDKATIIANFQSWSQAGGKRVDGLYRRRTEEAAMFLKESMANESYCKKFQRFYNEATQTGAPIAVDGVYGPGTQRALDTIQKLIKGGK